MLEVICLPKPKYFSPNMSYKENEKGECFLWLTGLVSNQKASFYWVSPFTVLVSALDSF